MLGIHSLESVGPFPPQMDREITLPFSGAVTVLFPAAEKEMFDGFFCVTTIAWISFAHPDSV